MNKLSSKRAGDPRDRGNYLILVLLVVLISVIPWPEIVLSGKLELLWDRQVYENQITTGENILKYQDFSSAASYFTSEYTWWYLIQTLQNGAMPFGYQIFFQLITTIYLSSAAIIVYKRCGILPLVFMASPLIFDLAYSQLRSALAITVLYAVYIFFRRSAVVALVLCLFAATIHTTMVLFLAIYILCLLTAEDDAPFSRWSPELRLALVLGAGFLMGLVIGPLRETLLSLIGDRRAHYQDLSSSALYLSFWVGLLGLFLMDYRNILRTVEGRFSLFILALVSVNIFTGSYSLRFLALAYPFFIIAVMGSRPSIRMIAVPALGVYLALQWYFYFLGIK